MTLETIEIDPAETPSGTVIWLHGLGADGHDFEPIVPELNLDVPIRFVFPHAPKRSVTINGGMEMRAWYDIDPGSPLSGTDEIRMSAAAVQELVDVENHNGMPTDRIVLAGFSQGGVVALHLGLRTESRFAGLMALSTYVHDHENVGTEVSFVSIDTPIFMAHGIADPMIPITRAVTSREALTALNYQVDWREYGMGHHVCPEELVDIKGFLERVLS
ncbi:MAG: alpha/beta hydrolase [Pseudomonadales bacterium]|jgi:phospholipase/carboxylesterase|nr:alpha/beta hydrolase [Pseudomonadales bacterium]|tara:strand:- start:3131 stop:3781 length:651 start_codon:yes stop_codon:yes gene_type:complete